MAFDRLEAMRAFCRIVELGSFTRAADTLGLAKTTVSGQVQALESQLGIRLLHRTTRRVSPTTDGSAYYERARAVLDELDELEASVSHNRGLARGRIRVEMPSPVSRFLVVPALAEFSARYPDIRLDLGSSERIVDLIQDGVDCAIRGGQVTDPDLVCRPIGHMRFCLCASPAYLAGRTLPQTPQDLLEHRYLAFVYPASGRQKVNILRRGSEQFTLEQEPAMRFNSGETYLTAVLAGLGFAILPAAAAQSALNDGRLLPLLPDWQADGLPLSLVYPYSRHLSARVRVFIDWVTELMADEPLWRRLT